MIWDQVMLRVVAEILADSTLVSIYGDAVRQAGTGDQQVPGLEWSLITDVDSELWSPILIQFDQWTRTAQDNRISEFQLRALYHRDLPREMELLGHPTMQMWTSYNDGTALPTPNRSGIVGRALRFRFTPLRRRYAGVGAVVG